MLADYYLGANRDRFETIYDMRHRWVPVFVRHYFWAGMSTTQRSESMNAFFDGQSNFSQGQKYVRFGILNGWEKEKQEDFRCLDKRPKLVTKFRFESHTNIYTENLLAFPKGDKASNGMLLWAYLELMRVWIRVSEWSTNRKFQVFFFKDSNEYECECMMFQFRGIVCRHSLSVYRKKGMDLLPERYLLNRWRKEFIRAHLAQIIPDPPKLRDIQKYDGLYACAHQVLLDIVEVASQHAGPQLAFWLCVTR